MSPEEIKSLLIWAGELHRMRRGQLPLDSDEARHVVEEAQHVWTRKIELPGWVKNELETKRKELTTAPDLETKTEIRLYMDLLDEVVNFMSALFKIATEANSDKLAIPIVLLQNGLKTQQLIRLCELGAIKL